MSANMLRRCFDCNTMTLGSCPDHAAFDEAALDAFDAIHPCGRPEPDSSDAFTCGAEWGAGWAFAIVGMAQAIRDRDGSPEYWEGFSEGYGAGSNATAL